MPVRRSLTVSALLFAGLAAAWWLSRPAPETEPGEFFSLGARLPDTLVVAFLPDTTVIVADGPTGWRIVRPVEDAADGVAVGALLDRLRPLVANRRLPFAPEKLDSYGLRYPRGWVAAAYADGSPPDTLVIGGFTVNGAQDYVRAGRRGDVGLVDARLTKNYLLRTTFDLRVTQLLRFHPSGAREVLVRDGSGRRLLRLQKSGQGRWTVEEPYPGPADGGKVDEFLLTLSHLKAEEFLAEEARDPARYGLRPPRVEARVVTAGGDTLGLALGDPVPDRPDQVYAVVSGRLPLLGVSRKYPPALQEDPDGLRQRALVSFGYKDVDSIAVVAGDSPVRVLTRGDWEGENAQAVVGDALRALFASEVAEFHRAGGSTRSRYGLVTGAMRTVWWSGTDTLAVMETGPPRPEGLPVRVVAGRSARPAEILILPPAAESAWSTLVSWRGVG